MIKFINSSHCKPYKLLRQHYENALKLGQNNIEAISIASYSKKNNEVNSRFVNLKYVDDSNFIFFTNYNSPKSVEFEEHNQISALIFWDQINLQIRMKATITKTDLNYNNQHFQQRSHEKNALAISSMQSEKINSYDEITKNFNYSMIHDDLKSCPGHWGGFSFTPFYFEFWEGHEKRINKRNSYLKNNNNWIHSVLQP
jgi:pyridoxamine 5'-phosphate oxidase